MEMNYARLWLGELIGLGNDTITLFTKHNLPNAGLNSKLAELKNQLKPLSDAFAIEKSSKLSKEIIKADVRRDKAISGIKALANAYSYHHDEAKRNHAEALLRGINKYGDNIAGLNYQLESETLRNLSQDFENDNTLKTAILAFNITDWAAELKTANQAFGDIFMSRNEEVADKKVDGKTGDFRKNFIFQYKELLKHLEAMQTIDANDAQKKLLGEIDALINKYDRLVQSHGSKEEA
ncbi:MAG: DUF6261 family protein [Cytophagales bacterium]